MRNALSGFAGRELTIDESVFNSEKLTGDRNRAIAYLMRGSNMLKRDPEDASIFISSHVLAARELPGSRDYGGDPGQWG